MVRNPPDVLFSQSFSPCRANISGAVWPILDLCELPWKGIIKGFEDGVSDFLLDLKRMRYGRYTKDITRSGNFFTETRVRVTETRGNVHFTLDSYSMQQYLSFDTNLSSLRRLLPIFIFSAPGGDRHFENHDFEGVPHHPHM